MTTLVLASRNARKLVELRRVLESLVPGLEVVGLDDITPFAEPAETEPTFEGNALIKARACSEALVPSADFAQLRNPCREVATAADRPRNRTIRKQVRVRVNSK